MRLYLKLILLGVLYFLSFVYSFKFILKNQTDDFDSYPNYVPKRYRIRMDENGEEVTTGRLDRMGGISAFVKSIDNIYI